MSSRRLLLCLLLLLAIVVLAAPPAAEAGVFDSAWDGPDPDGSGLVARLVEWLETLFGAAEQTFTAQEGASLTGNG